MDGAGTATATGTVRAGTCALILAAGRGVRFGATDNKVFSPLLNRPLLGWTLGAFADCPEIEAIVLVGADSELERLQIIGTEWGGGKVVAVVPGGDDRQASVRKGLTACAGFEYVAIHDGARPCVTPELIASCVMAGQNFGSATLAIPVADTLVRGRAPHLEGPDIDRTNLYAIQTPQVFPRAVIVAAHDIAAREGVRGTDDASLVRRQRGSTHLVMGAASNIKVTLAEDLQLAEAILARRVTATPTPVPTLSASTPTARVPFRVGHGYDVHPFAAGRRLFLGGVEFPDAEQGLLGHSDADVVLHALCDALLGAAGMEDIGHLFPPSDMRHKDRRSTEFLDEVRERLTQAKWGVGNVDITILAEKPKIGPMADAMRREIAVHLDIEHEQIGIKATTNEGLGFIGRSEGIAVHATAMLVRLT